jgi:hypothetical protein
VKTRRRTRPPQGGAWMDDLDWLRSRERTICWRIHNEGSVTPRVPVDPSSRRARRLALGVVQRRIAELESPVHCSSSPRPASFMTTLRAKQPVHEPGSRWWPGRADP